MIDILEDYSGLINIIISFFSFLTAVITSFLFLGILFLTWCYAKSTKDIARKTSESTEITKEKEKIDNVLQCIKDLDHKAFKDLIRSKYEDYPELDNISEVLPKAKMEVDSFLYFFDTVATLYLKDKLDKELFEAKLEGYYLSFFGNLKNEISYTIKELKKFGGTFYYYENFLKVIKTILIKRIEKKSKMKEQFNKNLEQCNDLLE